MVMCFWVFCTVKVSFYTQYFNGWLKSLRVQNSKYCNTWRRWLGWSLKYWGKTKTRTRQIHRSIWLINDAVKTWAVYVLSFLSIMTNETFSVQYKNLKYACKWSALSLLVLCFKMINFYLSLKAFFCNFSKYYALLFNHLLWS